MRSQRRLKASEAVAVRDELLAIAADWRRVLADDPTHARPIISSLLRGRVTFTPLEERHRWRLNGEGTLSGLFERLVSRGGEVAEKISPRWYVPNGIRRQGVLLAGRRGLCGSKGRLSEKCQRSKFNGTPSDADAAAPLS